jgi:uncharacterized protein YuzB (UPF0349 family)
MDDAGADIRSAIDDWIIEQKFTLVDGDIDTGELADRVLINLYALGWRVTRA